MTRAIVVIGLLLLLGGCVNQFAQAYYRHESNEAWCEQYYGNKHCFKNGWPTAYTWSKPGHFPMGFN